MKAAEATVFQTPTAQRLSKALSLDGPLFPAATGHSMYRIPMCDASIDKPPMIPLIATEHFRRAASPNFEVTIGLHTSTAELMVFITSAENALAATVSKAQEACFSFLV